MGADVVEEDVFVRHEGLVQDPELSSLPFYPAAALHGQPDRSGREPPSPSLPGRPAGASGGLVELAGCTVSFFRVKHQCRLAAGTLEWCNRMVGLCNSSTAVEAGTVAHVHLWDRGSLMIAVKGLFMEKWLCIGSMGVAGLLILLFLLDIFVSFPFGGSSVIIDVFGIVAAAVVLYLGFDAFRDLR
jgi:hypothetical protein